MSGTYSSHKFDVTGKYNKVKVLTENIDAESIAQLIAICNVEEFKDAELIVMPDVHAGKDCVVGLTIKNSKAICPNLVGSDGGCGLFIVKLFKLKKGYNLDLFDAACQQIPTGTKVNGTYTDFPRLKDLRCFYHLTDVGRIEKSLGTLGSGNHFISFDKDEEGWVYLTIHSGSRNLGTQVNNYYDKISRDDHNLEEISKTIQQMKKQGKHREIQKFIESHSKTPKKTGITFLPERKVSDYINDIFIVQEYAKLNRELIGDKIVKFLDLKLADLEQFHVVHNYISNKDGIIRKGAISAHKGELVAVPLNMRDGIVLGIGKGNPDWNYSAPHGAGRIMSRKKAKQSITMESYIKSMEGIASTSVKLSTIDEAPEAYKPMEDILLDLSETIKITNIIKPLYNFKDSSTEKPYYLKDEDVQL